MSDLTVDLSQIIRRDGLSEQLVAEFFDSILEQAALSPEQQAKLAEHLDPKATGTDILGKRDRLVEFLQSCEHEAEYQKQQAAIRTENAKRFYRVAEIVKETIRVQLGEMWAVKAVAGREHRITVKRNPASVVIDNPELVPPEYIGWEPVYAKTAIKDALEAGKTVPGCRLVTDRSHLEVR